MAIDIIRRTTGRSQLRLPVLVMMLATSLLAACGDQSRARYLDDSDGSDWPGYGRTYGQQHYSPLDEINVQTVGRLGLQWSRDLPFGNSASEPIAVDGIVYYATGLSVIHAVDAVTGEALWEYDPGVGEKAGLDLRSGWGVRGISWWKGKIYTGTTDGRLIAIDAKNGKPVWTAETLEPDTPAHVNGAPRVMNGKVVIGFASTTGAVRPYVTAYDAETGRQLWRFHVTPGNPADGFENDAMKMAAKTWAGEWWKFGGGGTVWNAITYDDSTNSVIFGTGSGYPWNRRVRSEDKGDNLFISSIVALDATTGDYKWHYQVNPGDTWDFDATMDIALADLEIDGKLRQVLIQAPKNGFLYVIDRTNGKLISAKPFVKVNWALGIDLKTGRPIEAPGARYPDGQIAQITPTGVGAHNWMPMGYSPATKLVYIPAIQFDGAYTDRGVDLKGWKAPVDRTISGGLGAADLGGSNAQAFAANMPTGRLIAWDPVKQAPAWKYDYPTYINGGVLPTAGGLVFQSSVDGLLRAFDARSGKLLWSYKLQTPSMAAPISYRVNGRQYVTLMTGLGMGFVNVVGSPAVLEKYGIDPRSQARRIMTFALDGKGRLPAAQSIPGAPEDKDYKADAAKASRGAMRYAVHCAICHGSDAIGVTQAPDLRRSAVPPSGATFQQIVRNGALVANGMPQFSDLTEEQVEDIRQYLRSRSWELRNARGAAISVRTQGP